MWKTTWFLRLLHQLCTFMHGEVRRVTVLIAATDKITSWWHTTRILSKDLTDVEMQTCVFVVTVLYFLPKCTIAPHTIWSTEPFKTSENYCLTLYCSWLKPLKALKANLSSPNLKSQLNFSPIFPLAVSNAALYRAFTVKKKILFVSSHFREIVAFQFETEILKQLREEQFSPDAKFGRRCRTHGGWVKGGSLNSDISVRSALSLLLCGTLCPLCWCLLFCVQQKVMTKHGNETALTLRAVSLPKPFHLSQNTLSD